MQNTRCSTAPQLTLLREGKTPPAATQSRRWDNADDALAPSKVPQQHS